MQFKQKQTILTTIKELYIYSSIIKIFYVHPVSYSNF